MAQTYSDDDRKRSKKIIHRLILKKYYINYSHQILEYEKLKKS